MSFTDWVGTVLFVVGVLVLILNVVWWYVGAFGKDR